MESTTSPVLQVQDLNVFYGPKQAVADVSFEVRPGEIFGLLGPNGAGKTSTLSAIEGLLKPKSGSIHVAGIDLAEDPLPARANMGVQLQATSFHADLTVAEIIRLYAGLYGLSLSGADIDGILGEIQLGDEAGKRFAQLSGGQQQRVSLVIATLHRPMLLLLDEPTTGLDPQSRRQLWARIERLRDSGRAIILTTHSMEEAESVCDRIAIIDHGTILVSAPPAELVEKFADDPRVKAVSRAGRVTLEDVFIGLTGSEIRP